MDVTLHAGLMVAVNVAAAVMFLYYGRRRRDPLLLGVGVAFLAAAGLVAGGEFFHHPMDGYGYSIDFVASLAGWSIALHRYAGNLKAPRA